MPRLWCVLVASCFMGCDGGTGSGPSTVAEVEVVRPGVTLGSAALEGRERVSPGGAVALADGARAWVRHDLALRLLLDGGGKLTVRDGGVALDAGRAWVEGARGTHATIAGGEITVDVGGAALEARRTGDGLALYVGRGEVTWHRGAERGQVRAGESAELGAATQVQPATLWDDWTGGLAWPEAAGATQRRGFGEIGARRPGSLGEARFPLAVPRLEVRTEIIDDSALTKVVQTFFNPASETLEGVYRVRIPEGAILQRFAIDRDGRWADGYVKERETARAQYQAQVYAGSTKDPALLEWEAPGSFRARIYPIPAGATRRILIEYSEWMTPHGSDGERTWRYPMAGDSADAPLIQELDVEVDAQHGGAKTLRAGLGARIEGAKVIFERSDYRPGADLVVDLVGPARSAGEARAYRSPHRVLRKLLTREDDYYLLRALPLPAEAAPSVAKAPLDLVILTDVSAGTDATHLQLARTTVDALLRHLGDQDRVAVVGADLELHPADGARPVLAPAAHASAEKMLEQLARQRVGGASDLGAVLTQAASLLDPRRRGAVVYVGDALPTVGELDLKTLRERLDRLPAPLRLYGVAVGDEADLALLEGLSSDGGLAMRVLDRAGAANAALRILGHAAKRALYRVKVDLGSGLDRVYPRRLVTVVEGEPLPVLARVRGGLPSEISLSGWLAGEPWKQTVHVTTRALADDDDVRLRWAQERLRQLLADGGSAEEVAELGTRQNLITPFTSYYVPSADELSMIEIPPLPGPEIRSAGCDRAPGMSAPSSSSGEAAPKIAEPPPPPVAAPTVAAAPPADPAAPRHAGDEGKMGKDSSRARADAPAAATESPPPAPDTQPQEEAESVLGGLRGEGAGGVFAQGNLHLGSIGGKRAPADKAPAPAKASKSLAKEKAGDDDGLARSITTDQEDLDGNNDRLIVQVSIYTHRPRHCSEGSRLDASDRAALWRERLSQHRGVRGAMEVWQDAGSGCELKSWGDRRELLRAMLGAVGGAAQMVQLYNQFGEDPAAQDFLRRAMLGLVKSAADLRTIVDGIGLSEDVKWTLVDELVAKAKTPADRVAALEQLAARWPDNLRLKLRRIEALEAVKRLDEARRLADEVRVDPYADAQARTLVGEFLVRSGDEPSARRAFSEIVEFAPRDPQARRRLGDLYRAHNWFDEAYRQYQTLAEMAPGDQSVLLLEGAAAAGAGRVDEALRLEQRVSDGTEPGTETGVPRAALWWSSVRLGLLRQAARDKGDVAELARLMGRTRRANVLHSAQPFHAFLIWSHPEADCELSAQLPGGPMSAASDVASEFGIATLGSHDALSAPAVIEVKRSSAGAAASRLQYRAELILIWNEGEKGETLQRIALDFGPGRTGYRALVDGGKAVLQ